MNLRILLALGCLLLALPAQAQVRKPGADFYAEPEWSEKFTQGMIQVQKRDFVKAQAIFEECIAEAKDRPDGNCEYYLSLMYHAKGDIENWRKWLYTAATHGHQMASTTVDLIERFK